MSDDELPPPPVKPQPVVQLPDSDPDEELPPPPVRPAQKKIVLPDSGDDSDGLPPPPPPKPAVKEVILDTEEDEDLPLPPPPAPRVPEETRPRDDESAALRSRSRHVNVDASKRTRRQTTVVRSINDVSLEGFLFKQSPSWPHGSQKRWIVLKGRTLSYFESQGTTTSAGTLDLKGAVLVDVSKTAKMPHSFGLTGPSGQLKSRTYVFSALSREDYEKWVQTIELVIAEPKVSELHWFDKMAQAIF